MEEERQLPEGCVGWYLDGSPISEHPSPEEIGAHLEEWIGLVSAIENRRHREVIEEMRNWQINTHFARKMQGKSDAEVIEEAIKWWKDQWPWEWKPFIARITAMRQTLYDMRGFAKDDQQKSLVLYGSMPDRVKTLGLAVRPDFWSPDPVSRKQRNLKTFYELFEKAKISDYKGGIK